MNYLAYLSNAWSAVVSASAEVVAILDAHEGAITAVATIVIALFTIALSTSTKKLWREAEAARAVTKKAAEAAERSADTAFKTAMPVLSPYVTGMHGLHPLNKTIVAEGDGPPTVRFDSHILFSFENYGTTPGVIREVRADLYILNVDEVPRATSIDFGTLPTHSYQVVVPGSARQGGGVTSVIDYKKHFIMQPSEFDELIKDGPDSYRRFALIGRVIYDDFFGVRHTRLFCIKMRLWRIAISDVARNSGDSGIRVFQSQFGGMAYSKITRVQIPTPDPFEEFV